MNTKEKDTLKDQNTRLDKVTLRFHISAWYKGVRPDNRTDNREGASQGKASKDARQGKVGIRTRVGLGLGLGLGLALGSGLGVASGLGLLGLGLGLGLQRNVTQEKRREDKRQEKRQNI
jgi:hypothetical protein